MDKAHKKTDKKLSKLEKELLEVYKETYKNIDKEIRKILDNPKFKPGENNYILISKLKRFKELQTNIAKEISNINKNSVERIIELLDEVSEINYEFAREEIEIKVDNIKWGILNPKTYKEILKEQENPLFYLSIDDLKERSRIYNVIKKELALGLVQGESIPSISKRLQKVLNTNYKSATRIARTEVTRAENSSRLSAFKHASKLGIKQKKVWIATNDSRTRNSHKKINGEMVEIDKPFSNGLMYPGDSRGKVEEVINCRCTIGTYLVDYEEEVE